jgi:folate/biopterin transporter
MIGGPANETTTGTAKSKPLQRILLGHEPTPELIAILLVYAVQGILGISRLAVSFFLKDELSLSPAEVSALMGVAALPWVVKPLFGFISDGLPVFGYRRRPYLILAGLLGIAAWTSLATLVATPAMATLAIALTSLSVAFSDVIVDSLVVERARKEAIQDAGSLQSLCWGASAVGGLLTAYFSGLLLQYFTARTVFGITACFPAIVTAAAWLIAEKPSTQDIDPTTLVPQQVKQLWQAVKQKAIWLPTLFLFLWQSTPTAESSFFFFATNELGFPPEFLGRVRLVTSLASLVGIWLFQKYFRELPFRKIFTATTLLSALLGMTTLLLVTHTNRTLGIDDRWFSLGDTLVLTVMGQISFMPVLVLATRLCPPGIEATLFAMLMSVMNLAGLVSQEFGALLTHLFGITETNFDRLWQLVLITNIGSVVHLIFIKWLPDRDPKDTIVSTVDLPSATSLEHLPNSLVGERGFPELMPEFIANEDRRSA